ncbi:MAG: multiple sugar transport system permease protein, partial [Granulosicoccus sp.]
FKIFDIIYIITEGGPGSSTESIAVNIYRMAFQNFRTSRAGALAYIILFIVIVLTNLYLYSVNRRANEETL